MFLTCLILLLLLLATDVHESATRHGFTSRSGIPTIPWEEVFPLEQHPSLLVLDDLVNETVDSDQVMDLLSKRAHHLNLFVILVTQNLCKHSIGMNRNYPYTIHFRNPADTCHIKHWGNVGWVMQNVLCHCTSEPLLYPMGIWWWTITHKPQWKYAFVLVY